jgi:zinc/manganese transport system ATP-binding protein
MTAALELRNAGLSFGARKLWAGLDLRVDEGEFLAVLGANGSGKTSLLRVVLGQQPLSAGMVAVAGRPPGRDGDTVGYVPQHRRMDPLTPMRARDVVRQGLDGHRWGIGRPDASRRARVAAVLRAVDAAGVADVPVGLLSGGEQQRVRVAQALVANPRLLLCDEPLLSLDPNSQRAITALVDRRRRSHATAVVFVTHDINPVLPYVDRVLYLAHGAARVGTVADVLNSAVLTDLYGAPIDVVRAGGRILVAGAPDTSAPNHHDRATRSDE